LFGHHVNINTRLKNVLLIPMEKLFIKMEVLRMKKIISFVLVALLFISLSINAFAITESTSNSNYRLTGSSNLNIGSSTWTASSSSSTTKNVGFIQLHSYVYVDGILLHDEPKSSSANTNLVSWNSQTWNRASFSSFENMTYHSTVDVNLGNLSVVSDVTW
jgi:hypothetical protein